VRRLGGGGGATGRPPAAAGRAAHPPWIGPARAGGAEGESEARGGGGGGGGGGGRGFWFEPAYIRGGVRRNAFWLSDPIRRPLEEAHLFGPAGK
jgi:hypothetical protein